MKIKILLLTAYFSILATNFAAPFAVGNIVVVRVIDGNGTLTNVTAGVCLDEYTTNGTFAQTIVLPTNGVNAFTSFGAAVAEGALSSTPNGKWLCLGGYNTAVGYTNVTSSRSSQVPRVVGVMDALGNFAIAATNAVLFDTNNIRGACSDGTNNFWANGSVSGTGVGGIDYYGFKSQAITILGINSRVCKIVNGSLYYSQAGSSGGLNKFNGTPTTSATSTAFLVTGPSASSSPYGFAINTSGNIAYVADDQTSSSGGIQRWSNSGGSWSLAYKLGTGVPNEGARGLVVDWSASNPVIYASSSTVPYYSISNRVIRIVDTGAESVAVTLAVASTNSSFRGVEFVPIGNPPIILSQPASRANLTNTAATFNVSAGGELPLAFQWLKNGVSMTDVGNISGSSTAILNLTNVLYSDAANYSVIITNVYSAVTSSIATLTVLGSGGSLISSPQASKIRTGTIILGFQGVTNTQYIVQYANNLSGPWLNLSTNFPDTNGNWNIIDAGATNAKCFYRVIH
jgi:hypothetical protein